MISLHDMHTGSNVRIANVFSVNSLKDETMLRNLAHRAVLALLLVLVYGGPANADLIQFQGTTPGGPVDATAGFTLVNGTLHIDLTDLLQNPTSDAQLISGISFTVSGALGSSVLTSARGLDSSRGYQTRNLHRRRLVISATLGIAVQWRFDHSERPEA